MIVMMMMILSPVPIYARMCQIEPFNLCVIFKKDALMLITTNFKTLMLMSRNINIENLERP